jgi:cytochrome P450
MTAELATPVTLHTPPTVPGLPLIGNALPFLRGHGLPVEFMRASAARYGDVVHLRMPGRTMYMLTHPDLVHEVLVKRVTEFLKPSNAGDKKVALARFLGDGILTADFETWRPQRKLVQPLMHTKHIENYATTMGHMGDQLLNSWEDGTVRDIHADMTQVTMWIIADTMFGMNVNQTPAIEYAAHEAQVITIADLTSPLPLWLAIGRERQTRDINAILTNLVNQFMQERRTQGNVERHDLLSLLMNTRDENGQPMSDDLVRDNILTLFFAGHETTANTLTWVFYYLDRYPDVAAALQQEVDTVLGGRLPTLADLPQLPYTMMVIKETMRIESTVPTLARLIDRDTEIGGFTLKANSVILLPLYVLHRDTRWWTQPDEFIPTRFNAENEPNIPKYAYLPFGGGPRVCIGVHFSLMEAQILLALIVSRYKLRLVSGTQVEAARHITTSPLKGLPMRLERRA